jgi:hypothetical protein
MSYPVKSEMSNEAVASAAVGPVAATIIGAVITFVGTLIQTAVQAGTETTTDEGPAAGSVDAMKAQYGDGIATLITIENATGGPMTLVTSYDYHGHISSFPIPPSIGCGQTGCFLHVHSTASAVGSEGAVVYRFTDTDSVQKDLFYGWCTPFSSTAPTVYTEVREAGHWPAVGSWSFMQNQIENGGSTSRDDNGSALSIASIGNDSSPHCIFHATYDQAKSARARAMLAEANAASLESRVKGIERRLGIRLGS